MAADSSAMAGRGASGMRDHRAVRASRWLVLACASLIGCDGPPDRTPTLGDVDLGRARQLVFDKGCTACHSFPDRKWPRGSLGPSLDGFGDQGLIAGRLPNQPGTLMQFIRNAPAMVPGTAMPAIAMTDQEARDVTAYLLQLKSR
ncbi:c-type cytochrome [Piscinibacter sakaiensis]|uniref:c-type cytochrome n=1 Tax=Piscinibacter sakaiensis TaxID=1547922 RepID=UPI003AAEDC5E